MSFCEVIVVRQIIKLPKGRLRWVPLLGLLLSLVFIVIYRWNGKQIEFARWLRRADQLAKADEFLYRCWSLPGQSDAIRLEAKLCAVQQGDLHDEATLLELAKRSPTIDSLILESLCKGNMAIFRWNEARTYAEEIIKHEQNDAAALWLRGRCWIKLQQENKAIDDFKQAISVSPSTWEYRLSLAELLQQQGFNSVAMNYYRELVQEKQFDSQILLGLARCLQEAGELAEAARTLKFLLELQPKSVMALVERSRLGLRQGNIAEAESWARNAAMLSPRNQEVNFVLSLCIEAQGKQDMPLQRRIDEDDRSRVELKKLLRDSSSDSASLCRVGHFMMETDEELEGIGCYQRALSVDPNCEVAHEALAQYFERVGQFQLAMQHRLATGTKLANARIESRSVPSVVANTQTKGFILPARPASPLEASTEQVHQLCGACHAYPQPESFPKFAWRKEVQLGFDFLRDSSKSGEFPSMESVVLYYENRAPAQLSKSDAKIAQKASPFQFEVAGGGWLKNTPPFPATTHVNFVRLQPKKNLDLIVCDARVDRILALDTDKKPPEWSVLGPALVPSHAEVVDLDGDGRTDVIAACLGQFFPTDDKVGSVVWLRATADGKFSPITLLDGVGRVADVQAADFNGDGLTDLIVAVFGWRKGGEILYLQNRTTDWDNPHFESHRIDNRHGTIHVPVVDLNKDGLPDFVALISQEHETVVAFLNEGEGRFRKETIFAAPHPAFGCSGIQLVDMDRDNDLDVLLTNGDVLDRPYILKPYHGVQWLENNGRYPFDHHPIASMYGAARAVAADMDGDNDIDVVAVSFLPASEFPDRDRFNIPSAILFEQTDPGNFAVHILETGDCDHFSCAVADWNNDGKSDLALGNFSWKRSQAIKDAVLLLKSVESK